MKTILNIFTLILLLTTFSFADIIHVPVDINSIQGGIDLSSDGDTVLVDVGTYVENITFNGKNIVVGSLFLTTGDTLYISQTIIDGNGSGSVVTFNNDEDLTTVLCGFTIRNGSADNGGGIFCEESSPRLENLIIKNNSALTDGGGIFAMESDISVNNVIVKNNTAEVGAGFFCAGSDFALKKVIVDKNSALREGGGFQIHESNLQLDSCTISNNHAPEGGGGFQYLIDEGSTETYEINITRAGFVSNSTEQAGGGMAVIKTESVSGIINVYIDQCQFTANIADVYGGLRISGESINCALTRSSFIGNGAVRYSAGAGFDSQSIGLVSNCLFSFNGSTTNERLWNSGGAGVMNEAEVDFVNCTFIDNSAIYGAGLTVESSGIATTTNCILWGNTNDQVAIVDANLTISYCDVEGGQEGINVIYGMSALNWGEGNIDINPMFVDWGNEDFHLNDYSMCLGSGTPTGAPINDFDDNPRPDPPGSNPDMGAYENSLGNALQEPHIIVSEDTLNFAQVFLGVTDSLELEVRNGGTLDLLITSVFTDLTAYSVEPDFAGIDPNDSQTFLITFSPQTVSNYSGILTLINNDPDSETLVVYLEGQGVEPPIITVSPDSLSEALISGETSTQIVTISNITGASDLHWNIELKNTGLGTVTFSKEDYADWSDPVNQDRITDNVWITRDDDHGLFNAATETYYEWDSPHDTEWSYGLTEDLNVEDYQIWRNEVYPPPSMIDRPLSLHLISDDKYFDVIFHSWTVGSNGGGFSYTRTDLDPRWLFVSEESGIIPAGSTSDIEVTFDAAGLFGGDYDANMMINSNDPVNPFIDIPATLTVTGIPNIALTISPFDSTSTIYWNSSGASTIHNFATSFNAVGDGELTVTIDGNYYSSSEYAEVYIEGDYIGTLNPNFNGAFTQNFNLTESNLNNYISDGTVSVTVNNFPDVDPWYANDFHSVRLTYSGASDSLDFGEAFVNYEDSREILIENAGTGLLEISSISIDSAAFSVSMSSVDIGFRESDILTVSFLPTTVRSYSGMLTLVSNDPDQGTIEIPLLGESLVPPVISVTPDSLSAELSQGDTSTQTLTIFNTGGSDLNFSISNTNDSYNYALQFEGEDDYVDCGINILHEFTDWTIESWIYCTGGPDQQVIYSETGTESGDQNLKFMLLDGRLNIYLDTYFISDQNITATSDLRDSKWHHVIATKNGDNITLYIDNVNEVEESTTRVVGSGLSMRIGFCEADWTPSLSGIIDEVRIWSVARTEMEIQADMYREIAGDESGLIGYWRFNEGTGNTTYDLTSNGNDGSLRGGPAWVVSTAPLLTWLSVEPVFGTLTANNHLDLDVIINTAYLNGGDYEQNIIINSNDPNYQQVLIPVNLTVTPSGIEDPLADLPKKYVLYQNYPNPFNPVTHIRFGLPKATDVRIELYNILGQKAVTILEEYKAAGYHTADFDASRLASGVYYYRIETGDFQDVKKMVLLK